MIRKGERLRRGIDDKSRGTYGQGVRERLAEGWEEKVGELGELEI